MSRVFLLIFTGIIFGFAPVNAEGADWEQFIGEYVFVECENNGFRIWDLKDLRHDLKIVIFEDRSASSINKNNLHMMLRRISPHPIALSWGGLQRVNQGLQQKMTENSISVSESFTNEEGLHSFYHWRNSTGQGWNRLHLKNLPSGNVEYEMVVSNLYAGSDDARSVKVERCELKRR